MKNSLEEALEMFQKQEVKASLHLLKKAFERISDRYRKEIGVFLETEEERWAYLFTRLPATFSACRYVLEELKQRNPQDSYQSFLDVGSGPGTASWAAFETLQENILSYTLLEKDHSFMTMGKKLLSFSPAFERKASWQFFDMNNPSKQEIHDIVFLSYSLGELKEKERAHLIDMLWDRVGKVLIIVEPGTPSGYEKMMKIRDLLLAKSAYLWAPCPHSCPCPLRGKDWCHFSTRVARTSLHRNLKSGDLGYEDEKFCYLIFAKNPAPSYQARIIRHPILHSGFVEMTLCEKEKIDHVVFSKRNKEKYRAIKKLNWGDVIT